MAVVAGVDADGIVKPENALVADVVTDVDCKGADTDPDTEEMAVVVGVVAEGIAKPENAPVAEVVDTDETVPNRETEGVEAAEKAGACEENKGAEVVAARITVVVGTVEEEENDRERGFVVPAPAPAPAKEKEGVDKTEEEAAEVVEASEKEGKAADDEEEVVEDSENDGKEGADAAEEEVAVDSEKEGKEGADAAEVAAPVNNFGTEDDAPKAVLKLGGRSCRSESSGRSSEGGSEGWGRSGG